MGLGIVLTIAVKLGAAFFGLYVYLLFKDKLPICFLALLITLVCIVIGMPFIISVLLNTPSYKQAEYSTHLNNSLIYFNKYYKDSNIITIPTHYFIKTGFINEWKYCNVPLVLSLPASTSLEIETRPAPAESIEIISGAVNCEER